jgi:KDO2-lipid IV(A) lauroyltransferase
VPAGQHLYMLAVVALIEAANRSRSPVVVDGLARALARLAYRLSRTKRRSMERNLTRIFPSLDDTARAHIVRGAFHTFWDETLAFIPWRAAATSAIEVTGLDHLNAGLAAGNGVVLWESRYFGRRNLAKQVLHRHGFRIVQVHDVGHRAGFAGHLDAGWVRDAVVLTYFEAREREFIGELISLPRPEPLAAIRALLAALRRNSIACITADVAQGHRLLTLPLLGAPATFATGMVSTARAAGAPLLPLFCVREPDARFRVVIEPPVPVTRTRDGNDDAAVPSLRAYATLLASYIRRYPEQYRNWHFPWWERQ